MCSLGKYMKKFLVLAILLQCFCFSYAFCRDGIPSQLPMPAEASPELQESMDFNIKHMLPFASPKDTDGWKKLAAERAAAKIPGIRELIKTLGLKCDKSIIAGVPCFLLEPPDVPQANQDKILLFLHGGGYVFNPGEAGLDEGIYMAAIAKYRILAVDYRLAPEHPFPAALEDALAVYKKLLDDYPPENIGVFGSSTGGALTLSLCLMLKQENLPMPGGIAAGTPWSDLSKNGDSYFINDGVDNVLIQYEGWLEEAAKAYANGRDFKKPLLSPIYGDFSGFPPTLLVTGTRDLFLSNTARTHRKLREAGIPADLLVIEGLSHWQYVQLPPDAPETQYYFTETDKFFHEYLGK